MENQNQQRRLFLFNPDCELAIANGGRFYMPSANIVKMAEDLAFLPAWLKNEEDLVLVKELPDTCFKDTVTMPLLLNGNAILESQLENYSNLKGEPWGRSPKMCHWLAERNLGEEWRTEEKEWYSRKIAQETLGKLLKKFPFVDEAVLPLICYSIDELENSVQRKGRFLVKAPWSSSGKGLLTLENGIALKEKEWLSGMLKRQGYLMLENYWEKTEDFAMEFWVGEKGIEFIGWSVFSTGARGEYLGNCLGTQKLLEERLVKQLGINQIEALKQELPQVLNEVLPLYRGYLGVDMLTYRLGNELKVQPCVEINLRYNMGIVALFLSRRHLDEETQGEFTVRFYPGKGEALQQHQYLQQNHPVVYNNNRILSGYLNLTPINEATHFVASMYCY